MFVFSFKASTLKYIGVMSLCVMAIVLTVVLVPSNSFYENTDGAVIEVSAEREPGDTKNIKSNGDRLEFLKGLGWEADSTALSEAEITIPVEFDEVFSQYNELQKKEGFDLERYKGKKAMLYTYKVNNADGEAYANLLIYKNRVIGGDISSADSQGFCYGLGEKQ